MRKDLALNTKEINNSKKAIPYDFQVEFTAIKKNEMILAKLKFAQDLLTERF